MLEAQTWAEQNHLQNFSALSNNFSLAKMVNLIWPGVAAVDSDKFEQTLAEQDIALMPWSSQARGFFTPWADQVKDQAASDAVSVTAMQPTAQELQHVWFSDLNFERRRRAAELAEKYRVPMINVALAYVLKQAFKTFALIGPRSLAETRSCVTALHLPLTEAEVEYLRAADYS